MPSFIQINVIMNYEISFTAILDHNKWLKFVYYVAVHVWFEHNFAHDTYEKNPTQWNYYTFRARGFTFRGMCPQRRGVKCQTSNHETKTVLNGDARFS